MCSLLPSPPSLRYLLLRRFARLAGLARSSHLMLRLLGFQRGDLRTQVGELRLLIRDGLRRGLGQLVFQLQRAQPAQFRKELGVGRLEARAMRIFLEVVQERALHNAHVQSTLFYIAHRRLVSSCVVSLSRLWPASGGDTSLPVSCTASLRVGLRFRRSRAY